MFWLLRRWWKLQTHRRFPRNWRRGKTSLPHTFSTFPHLLIESELHCQWASSVDPCASALALIAFSSGSSDIFSIHLAPNVFIISSMESVSSFSIAFMHSAYLSCDRLRTQAPWSLRMYTVGKIVASHAFFGSRFSFIEHCCFLESSRVSLSSVRRNRWWSNSERGWTAGPGSTGPKRLYIPPPLSKCSLSVWILTEVVLSRLPGSLLWHRQPGYLVNCFDLIKIIIRNARFN